MIVELGAFISFMFMSGCSLHRVELQWRHSTQTQRTQGEDVNQHKSIVSIFIVMYFMKFKMRTLVSIKPVFSVVIVIHFIKIEMKSLISHHKTCFLILSVIYFEIQGDGTCQY